MGEKLANLPYKGKTEESPNLRSNFWNNRHKKEKKNEKSVHLIDRGRCVG